MFIARSGLPLRTVPGSTANSWLTPQSLRSQESLRSVGVYAFGRVVITGVTGDSNRGSAAFLFDKPWRCVRCVQHQKPHTEVTIRWRIWAVMSHVTQVWKHPSARTLIEDILIWWTSRLYLPFYSQGQHTVNCLTPNFDVLLQRSFFLAAHGSVFQLKGSKTPPVADPLCNK